MADVSNVVNIRKNVKETVKVRRCSKCDHSLYYAGIDNTLICATCRVRVAGCRVYLDKTSYPEPLEE